MKFTLLVVLASLGVGCKLRRQTDADGSTTKRAGDLADDQDDQGPVRAVYLAISARASGESSMGHAYLVVTAADEGLFNSTVYHFYVQKTGGGGDGDARAYLRRIPELMRVGPDRPRQPTPDFPYVFAVTKEPFVETFQKDRLFLNRNLFFYRLNLNAAQRLRVRVLLEAEHHDRATKPRFDYNLLSFNCLHAAAGVVNKAVNRPFLNVETVDGWWGLRNILPLGPAAFNFIPIVMMYELETKGGDILTPTGGIEVQKGGKKSASLDFKTLRESMRFFGYLRDVAGLDYTDSQVRALLFGLAMRDSSAATAKTVLHAQIFPKTKSRIDARFGPILTKTAANAQCELVAAEELGINAKYLKLEDALAVLAHDDLESLVRIAQAEPALLRRFVRTTPEQARAEFGDFYASAEFRTYSKRRQACARVGSTWTEFLVALVSRNLFYQYYRELLLSTQGFAFGERDDPSASAVFEPIFRDIGGASP